MLLGYKFIDFLPYPLSTLYKYIWPDGDVAIARVISKFDKAVKKLEIGVLKCTEETVKNRMIQTHLDNRNNQLDKSREQGKTLVENLRKLKGE